MRHNKYLTSYEFHANFIAAMLSTACRLGYGNPVPLVIAETGKDAIIVFRGAVDLNGSPKALHDALKVLKIAFAGMKTQDACCPDC